MFDLEPAISDWRKEMLAAGIKAPVPLEELESHLREEIERQVKSGVNEPEAFSIAAGKIGTAYLLKKEFKKIAVPVEMQLVQLFGIACGIVTGFLALWILLVMLTVHETNPLECILGMAGVISIVLCWRYGHQFLPRISNRSIRVATGSVCCLASVGGMALFIKCIPSILGRIPVGPMLVIMLWVWAALAILCGVAHGLEKAQKFDEHYV